jgi:acyl-CoA thioesterase-1
MVQASQQKGAKVLILGMQLPPNYGVRYTTAFAEVFPTVASETGSALVPFVLEGVGGVPSLMQNDGIHPTAEAQPKLLDNVWPTLKPLL